VNIIRWEPFRSMDDVFGHVPGLFGRWPRTLQSNSENRHEWSPSVDISETELEYVIRAELPAVKKEDVRVTFEDGMLTVSGERKQKKEGEGERFHRLEILHGTFSRSFSLPENVDNAAIRAESKDGVLTVYVPKAKTQPKQATEIKVQ